MIGYMIEATEEDVTIHCPRCGLALGLRQALLAAYEVFKARFG